MCMLRDSMLKLLQALSPTEETYLRHLRLMGFSRTGANLSWESIRFAHYNYIPTQSYKLMVQERTNTILEYSEHM